jgi:hypothetical protein
VVAKFTITETTMSGIGYTPAEPGEYAVVTWHNRMKLRVESIEDLVKVGYVESR